MVKYSIIIPVRAINDFVKENIFHLKKMNYQNFEVLILVDFENETFVVDNQATAILPWDANPTAVINLANAVTANSTHPLFLMLGIEFYQQVNGQMYPLKNGAFNALAIAEVDGN